MQALSNGFDSLLGLNADSPSIGQLGVRCLAFYAVAVAMVRLGDKRFLGKHTAFDVILAVILGSVVSRAITNNASILGMLAAGFMLVALHLVISKAAFHSDRFGTLVKGRARMLIRDGDVDWEAMKKSSITRQDLAGLLRTEAGTRDAAEIELAHLERSGDVSFIKKPADPRVVDIKIENGVQIVSVRLG